MMTLPKSEPIAIIGGGAFGLSTALELSKNGYMNITVFEKDEEIPSRWSAANDLNKIARAEYEDDWYTDLAIEAMKEWKTPFYAPYFHKVGYLNCCSEAASQKAVDTMRRFQAAAERSSVMKPFVHDVKGHEDLLQACWQFTGKLPGWKGYFNTYDGYVHSADALRGVYRAARSNGVRFFLGEKVGAVTEVVYENKNGNRRSVGVKTQDERVHPASLIVVAAGAAAHKIVPELGTNVSAKSWSVAHVRLTADETAALRGIPVVYARDLGFFFEPDPKTNLLKLCPMGGGYINTEPSSGISKAPEAPTRFVPYEDELKMKELLRQTLPHLADRPLVEKSLCWFADTDDSDFIIDYVPQTSSSVIVMTGDSGHGFKMFPIVGRWVRDLLIASGSQQPIKRWRWRDLNLVNGETSQDADVSWRVGEVKEFRDLSESPMKAKL
ncbi:FAD dependent oxidoreductase [Bimuria novae-zelandiae CBS 107.79]|uniref:FAD dependent oxidoreductase n=1 Tax=Bimuria novae-zelandiae CBS 107.79 TaxID=1447943 RepID=A0A6A5V547_9PLEO|nr:FAD dependent oxidoreductase [Bimuria novae-zelandiae CBS 107.79]